MYYSLMNYFILPQIQPGAVYRLLRVISRPLDDNLRILELCNIQKPLEALVSLFFILTS